MPALNKKEGSRKGGARTKEIWKNVIEAAELGNFGYIKDASPEIYVRNYATLHRIALDSRAEVAENE